MTTSTETPGRAAPRGAARPHFSPRPGRRAPVRQMSRGTTEPER
ncbi:hypothetical protein OG413_24340 [Streptomyces sp. NBC_01433]|nr:hypothetical protein [Streptomyces sp. NBC_01433]MCX4678405.1 hypothetical protein [Streptomyces sp. NBC_01433]